MSKRTFGKLPPYLKPTSKITLANYDIMAEWYGGPEKMAWGDNWPFLSHDPAVPATAEIYDWELYFRDHLGGFPKSYRLFRDGRIRYFNLPTADPRDFDASYSPRVVPWPR